MGSVGPAARQFLPPMDGVAGPWREDEWPRGLGIALEDEAMSVDQAGTGGLAGGERASFLDGWGLCWCWKTAWGVGQSPDCGTTGFRLAKAAQRWSTQ